MGSVSYRSPTPNGNESQRNRTDGQAFFVFGPGVEVEVSVVKALRISVGGAPTGTRTNSRCPLWAGCVAQYNGADDLAVRAALMRLAHSTTKRPVETAPVLERVWNT